MTIKDLLKKTPKDQWMMLRNCPGIHHVMTGIARAGIRADGIIKVQYCDFTERQQPASSQFLAMDEAGLTLLAFASELSSGIPNPARLTPNCADRRGRRKAMMTPTTTPPSEVGTSAWFALKAPGDAYMLAEMGQAACGHCALAAVLQMPVMFIRGAFPAPLWVSEKTMTQALDKLGVKWHVTSGWTERCVIWLQGLGSWMNPGVPMGARNQRTHWIAGSLHEGMKMVYDVNLGEWVTLDDWKADLLPDLLKAWKAKDFEVRTIINVRANRR